MRLALALLFMIPVAAHAQQMEPMPYGIHKNPQIAQCSKVEEDYGREMVDFYFTAQKYSTDRGGPVDPGIIGDIYSALVESKEFVHTNIQFVQRAESRHGEVLVAACRIVTTDARNQIENYARYLLREVDPRDGWSRHLAAEKFRMGLQQLTRKYQGY